MIRRCWIGVLWLGECAREGIEDETRGVGAEIALRPIPVRKCNHTPHLAGGSTEPAHTFGTSLRCIDARSTLHASCQKHSLCYTLAQSDG